MDPTSPWNYRLSENTITRDDDITYSYCVTGQEMTASPQPTSGMGPLYKGTIVCGNLVQAPTAAFADAAANDAASVGRRSGPALW